MWSTACSLPRLLLPLTSHLAEGFWSSSWRKAQTSTVSAGNSNLLFLQREVKTQGASKQWGMLEIRRELTWATCSKFGPVGFYGDSSKGLRIFTQQPEASRGWTQWRGKVALERRRGSISSSTATSALGSLKWSAAVCDLLALGTPSHTSLRSVLSMGNKDTSFTRGQPPWPSNPIRWSPGLHGPGSC